MTKSKKLQFTKAMEISGISPLPHYYEEIYTNLGGIRKLGLRGDNNYLFYSIDDKGAGHYEKHEMDESSTSFQSHFSSEENIKKYLTGVEQVIKKIHDWMNYIDGLDLSRLSNKEIADLFIRGNQIHGEIFSYFIISQPYRVAKYESAVRKELSKRVARARVDHYMSMLATTEKPTLSTNEEIDWLKLVIKFKSKVPTIKVKSLASDHLEIMSAVESHFEKYKVLTLGDGAWEYSIQYFLDILTSDYPKPIGELKDRLKRISGHGKEVLETRNRLIKELYLEPETVKQITFLADLGHSRFTMRIDGWVPNIRTIIKLDIELSNRIDYTDGMLNFLTEPELIQLRDEWKIISPKIVKKRMGSNREFLILNDKGKYKILFGSKAGKRFRKLVPEIDHTKTEVLKGMSAVSGKIEGQVCVYQWGDDMSEKLKVIKKYPILIAGQTRPAMMPLIRLAKGIVTDEGGITSHAAIVSRELGIPSVIGTTYATQTLKDGDRIELDADNGIVKRI